MQPNSKGLVRAAVADEARKELDAISNQRRNIRNPLIRQTDTAKEDFRDSSL